MQLTIDLTKDNLKSIKKEDVLTEIDYKRLDCLKNILKEYFNEIDTEKINDFSYTKEAFNKSKIPIISLIVVSLLISLILQLTIKDGHFSTCLILAYFSSMFLFMHNLTKIKKDHLTNNKSGELTKDFFIQKFKENSLEIKAKEMNYYNVFLKRLINYYLIKNTNDLSIRAKYFFEKKYAHDLTPEELLMSAILFRTYGSLVDTRD